jgi:acyl phosphate:glycerol-3-phosphate acyltransferase
MIIARIIAVAIGYACGLFETGYFYGKKKGVDIRTKGSGNSGATNTLRTFGWKAGLVTCLGDILKTPFLMYHGKNWDLHYFPVITLNGFLPLR